MARKGINMITNIKNHKVQCQDIMLGIDNLMSDEKADFVYSDPPWGQGNLKYWQTINKRHTGKEPNSIDYSKFLPHYFELVHKYAKDVIVIEYGVGWRNDIIKVSSDAGFIHGGCCTSLYSASKLLPLDVHVMSKSGNYKIDDEFADGCLKLRGLNLVKFVFTKMLPKDASIVLDPMCGMGYTAQATVDLGLSFRGNELNEKRLEKTIKRLQK